MPDSTADYSSEPIGAAGRTGAFGCPSALAGAFERWCSMHASLSGRMTAGPLCGCGRTTSCPYHATSAKFAC